MRIAECGRRRPVVRPGAARGFVRVGAARAGLGTTGAGLGTTGPTPEEIGRRQRPRAPVRRPRQNHRLARRTEFVRRRNLRSDTSIRTTDAVATEAARGVAGRTVSYLHRGPHAPSLAILRRSEVPLNRRPADSLCGQPVRPNSENRPMDRPRERIQRMPPI